MEIILAKTAGFCFGVQRAVDTVYQEISSGGPIYTYGPIIHNETVVADLESRGVHVIDTPEDIAKLHAGTLIIRSHGVTRELYETIRKSGLKCVDTTCPFVKRIHDIVEEESAKGSQIVIIGNAGHPEVEGTMGWSHTPVTVIETTEQARSFIPEKGKKVCVVSQTTFNADKFADLVAILKDSDYNVSAMNTICGATRERQKEAREIASMADAMIVIGGSTSSNSAKLFEICRKECPKTYFIQTQNDLPLPLTGNEKVVGITAGASTPKNIIEEVLKNVGTAGRKF
ncbi:MAG: 4-hydroxy-3-methylbut-2-enyl diphosphate reductase [Lachnospiraceae bacterium]|jgi:4-hydroxy-3-methylbut-2-enyl diphosphate reductase|nr:4-hydroxy-3-methylbut-2-enyl diphosphate reductase [Lachnospiraceae bacterium]